MSAAMTLPDAALVAVHAVLEPVTREFLVVLAKQAALVAELTRLAKRAKRIGAPTITWSFGAVENRSVDVRIVDGSESEEGVLPNTVTRLIPFVHLTLTGSRPKIAGWEFAATVQHLDGVNILRSCPRAEEIEVPAIYRTRGSVCDHCRLDRDRRDTYLVVNQAGEWRQVGSSCLVDFFGHEDPHQLAAYAEMLAAALSLCEGAEDGEGGWGGGGGRRVFALVEYLTYVAAEIRESGWTPKSAVPDAPGTATANRALDRIAPEKDAKPRDRSVLDVDQAVATATVEWALDLDAPGGERLNDYLWNLFAVAKSGIADRRTLGLAASMVAAHTKAEVRRRERAARKPSAHVGTVGETRSFALTLDRHFSFDTGWGPVSRFLFRDEEDNVFTWKASGDTSVIGCEHPNHHMVEGERYILTARIKKHDDYKGTLQTVLTLATIRPFTPETFQALRDEEVRKVLGKKVRAKTATVEEAAQFKALDTAKRADAKALRAAVAQFMVFATTPRTVHIPRTHEVLDVVGTKLHVDYSVRSFYDVNAAGQRVLAEDVSINVYDKGQWVADCRGPDALDKARKFVAGRLAKAHGANK
jgi:hypothetical protein